MQQTQALCDYCQEQPAVTTCEVCGSQICDEHKRDYGCEACNGGEQTFD